MPKGTSSGPYNADEPGYFSDTEPEPVVEPVEISEEVSTVTESPMTPEPSSVTQEPTTVPVPAPAPVLASETGPEITIPRPVLAQPSLFEPVANPQRTTME